MNVVWKDSEVNPSEDLTKLSQYAGAYTTTTIDKASEVNQMIKEKDQIIALLDERAIMDHGKISQLEQQLIEEKQKIEHLKEQLNIEKKNLDHKLYIKNNNCLKS